MPAETDTAHATTARRFFVVWQDPVTRELVRVGELTARGDGNKRTYEFSYTSEAATHPRFRPFPAFPDLDRTYRQAELFAFFQNRVMSPRRPDYPEYLSALGLSSAQADPVELLARTGGGRATDTIQVVPAPVTEEHQEVLHFLVSGVRYMDPEGVRLAQLEPGAKLCLRPEPDNDSDPRAVLLDARTDEPVGYIPSYLLDYLHKQRDQGADVEVTVEQVNGPDTPWHLRLLCRMDVTTGQGAVRRSPNS